MLSTARLDERFLDRPGCGDELYLDSRFRAALSIAGIQGTDVLLDIDVEDDDELANS